MRLILTLLATVAAAPVVAGPYDGVYRPDQPWAQNWDCESIGMDGGALAVRDGVFFGVEAQCQLTNPVSVRGMAATLYDAVCSGEGESYDQRMMLMTTANGIAFATDGVVSALRRCP